MARAPGVLAFECPPSIGSWQMYAAGTYCREGMHSYQWTDLAGRKWDVTPICRGGNRKSAGYSVRAPNGVIVARSVRNPSSAVKAAREACERGEHGGLGGRRKKKRSRGVGACPCKR